MQVNFAQSEYNNQNLGSEVGRRFEIGNKSTRIEMFRFFLANNNFDTVKFRINMYSIKNFKPFENILHENIFVEIRNKKTGWIEIDLKPYSIIVNEDIIASVEWVSKSHKGNVLTLPIVMPSPHVHFYKYGSQNKWKRFDTMSTFMQMKIKY
jgi:hypothetical protein